MKLLLADECAALVAEVTGKPFSVSAWRRAVSAKTKTNPAPDPEPDGAIDTPPLYSVRPRPRWDAEKVAAWALNRPGRGGGVGAPVLAGYWNASACADAAGISRAAWWSAVAYKTFTNPAPDPVPAREIPPAYRAWRYWRPKEVRAWSKARPGPGNRTPR